MAYKIVAPPRQDETLAPMLKTLYVCEAKGCGWVSERKARYCADHVMASQRVECEAEFARLNK